MMVSSPFVSTLLFLALALTGTSSSGAGATTIPSNHVHAAARNQRSHGHGRLLAGIQPGFHRLHRRRGRTCKAATSTVVPDAPGLIATSTETRNASTVTATATTKPVEVVSVSAPPAEGVPAPKSSFTTQKTSSATQKASTSTAAPPSNTPSASSSSAGSHKFTMINKCSTSVHPVVVSIACGYSPRCADASTAPLPVVGSLGAGQTAVVDVPDKFVGRVFSQNGKCGAEGENCTMLEFNLDADSFYTPNSYDISNIQGFTQSISLAADGCDTVTCTSASCSCENAYPIGDESGCGADLPVRACGAGNVGFTVVFCP